MPTFREDAEFAPFPESVEGRFPEPVEEEGQTENPLPQRYGTPMNPCDQSANNKWFPEKNFSIKMFRFQGRCSLDTMCKGYGVVAPTQHSNGD